MIDHAQQLCAILGAGACYEFSLMHAMEVEQQKSFDDVLMFHNLYVAAKLVAPDCTVLDAPGLLAYLTGWNWDVLKAGTGTDSAGRPYDLPLDYPLQRGEHDIHRFEWKVTERPGVQHVYGHFFYAGPGPAWDPIDSAITMQHAQGNPVSRRILRRKA